MPEKVVLSGEEISLIKPVLKRLKNKINVFGPLSGDSCFSKDIRKNFHGIICFYHDQGLIPIKLLDFKHSINITGGLPFLRVSPDHGPNFDIADKNCANSESLCAALKFIKKMYNFYPKKRLGQNFLKIRFTEKDCGIKNFENKSILEIGPGKGALTEYLLKKT